MYFKMFNANSKFFKINYYHKCKFNTHKLTGMRFFVFVLFFCVRVHWFIDGFVDWYIWNLKSESFWYTNKIFQWWKLRKKMLCAVPYTLKYFYAFQSDSSYILSSLLLEEIRCCPHTTDLSENKDFPSDTYILFAVSTFFIYFVIFYDSLLNLWYSFVRFYAAVGGKWR